MKLGMLGGGQLARMMALAAHPLGVSIEFIEPATDACSAPVARQLLGDYDDTELLADLAASVDTVTYEFENVPAACVDALARRDVTVFPPPVALSSSQDRWHEKSLCDQLGIPTPAHCKIDTREDLNQAVRQLGLPAVLKTRRFGYDGKGQFVVREPSDVDTAWQELGGAALILEAFVPFTRELSIIAVRDQKGEIRHYPLSENVHRDGILRVSRCLLNDPLQSAAQNLVDRLLNHLGYVGVIALELFQLGDTLLANEFAPRVHNSGHWTIEGAETSQFENHIRAVVGLPLGSTRVLESAAMVNFIGSMPVASEVLALEGVHLHDYGKSARAGRKVGHATLHGPSVDESEETLQALITLADEAERALV